MCHSLAVVKLIALTTNYCGTELTCLAIQNCLTWWSLYESQVHGLMKWFKVLLAVDDCTHHLIKHEIIFTNMHHHLRQFFYARSFCQVITCLCLWKCHSFSFCNCIQHLCTYAHLFQVCSVKDGSKICLV